MTDPISVAASSFAVVGVADVVLRACHKGYRVLCEIKDAPGSIENLKASLRYNTSLIQTLRDHLHGLKSAASSTDLVELQPAIEQFNVAINSFNRDMTTLSLRAQKYNRMNKTWANVKHVLAERDIHKITERMELAKPTLLIALSLIEGKQSAINQKKVENALNQSSQQIISTLEPLRQGQNSMKSQNATLLLHARHQNQAAAKSQREMKRLQHSSQKQHNSLRRQIGQDTELILKKLKDIHVASSNTITKRESNRKIFFNGTNLEAALTSLLLMKEHVRQAVVRNISHAKQGLSQKQMNHILSEFNHLVSSALQETAAKHPESTATPLDRWCDSEALGETPLANVVAYGFHQDSHQAHDLTLNPTSQSDKRLRLRGSPRYWQEKTAIGTLYFRIRESSSGHTREHTIIEREITFVPDAKFHSTAVTVRFIQAKKANIELKLCTQLNIFRIVKDPGVHFVLYIMGSVEDIDAAFREGRITPYDVTEDGTIISLKAIAVTARVDVMRYLDSQGIGGAALNGYNDMLGYHLLFVIRKLFQEANRSSELLSYLDDRINIFTMSNGLHVAAIFAYEAACMSANNEMITSWAEFLVQNGIKEEMFGTDVEKTFLRICAQYDQGSVHTLRLLLELGINPNTVGGDSTGHNAFHYALIGEGYLYGRRDLVYPDLHEEVLEEKLFTLIEAGTALHHRSATGLTPSVLAKYSNRWSAWCQALERAGLVIEEVLQVEMNEWLQEEGWENILSNLRVYKGGPRHDLRRRDR